MNCVAHGVAQSQTRLSDFHSFIAGGFFTSWATQELYESTYIQFFSIVNTIISYHRIRGWYPWDLELDKEKTMNMKNQL